MCHIICTGIYRRAESSQGAKHDIIIKSYSYASLSSQLAVRSRGVCLVILLNTFSVVCLRVRGVFVLFAFLLVIQLFVLVISSPPLLFLGAVTRIRQPLCSPSPAYFIVLVKLCWHIWKYTRTTYCINSICYEHANRFEASGGEIDDEN